MTAIATTQLSEARSHSMYFVAREELPELFKRTQHHVYFHMQNVLEGPIHDDLMAHHKGITVAELAKCLPWIPLNSAIFLYSSAGFSSIILAALAALQTTRELFLVREGD
jgi:hypothetical protein